jgi:hypothetical protein
MIIKLAAYTPPEIKPSHKGMLHRDLGIPEDQPIPEGRLDAARHSKDPAVRRRANFAWVARHKFHH